MFNINFIIDYPWPNKKFTTLFYRTWKTAFKHKFFEIQFIRDYTALLCIELHWKTQGDHAGIRFALGLFGYQLLLELYDSRHWDYKNNDWMTHEC